MRYFQITLPPSFILMPPASRAKEKCSPYASEILTLLKLSLPLFHENRTDNVDKAKPKAVSPGEDP